MQNYGYLQNVPSILQPFQHQLRLQPFTKKRKLCDTNLPQDYEVGKIIKKLRRSPLENVTYDAPDFMQSTNGESKSQGLPLDSCEVKPYNKILPYSAYSTRVKEIFSNIYHQPITNESLIAKMPQQRKKKTLLAPRGIKASKYENKQLLVDATCAHQQQDPKQPPKATSYEVRRTQKRNAEKASQNYLSIDKSLRALNFR